MIFAETFSEFFYPATKGGIVCRITSGNNSTDNAEVLFTNKIAVRGETIDSVANLLDGVLYVSAFQFNEEVSVLFRSGGVMVEKVVALVMRSVGIEVAINLVFVYDRCVTTEDGELALVFLYGEA